MITSSQELKQYISPLDVARKHLGEPSKTSSNCLWYISPFRSEKTASFCVSDERGFHDFGDGWHGDIFTFIERLYNLSFKDSMNYLAREFGFEIYNNEYEDTYIRQIKMRQIRAEKEKEQRIIEWFNEKYSSVCDMLHEYQDIAQTMGENTPPAVYDKINYYEQIIEAMQLYNDNKVKVYEMWGELVGE